MPDKTIDDVTREEWITLVEAMMDLLGAARMLLWMNGKEDDEDQSFPQSIDRAANALRAVGIDEGSTQEFIKRLESMLTSDMPPGQWRMLYDAKGLKQ